jgi:hypothetical protein
MDGVEHGTWKRPSKIEVCSFRAVFAKSVSSGQCESSSIEILTPISFPVIPHSPQAIARMECLMMGTMEQSEETSTLNL